MSTDLGPSNRLALSDRDAVKRLKAAVGAASIEIDGNPMAQALQARLEALDSEDGRLTMTFEPASCFLQGAGRLQGGAIAGMLDFAMAFSAMAQLQDGESCATVTLTTSMLRGAAPGRYLARGIVERRGRNMVFARAELATSDAPADLVATATSVLMIVR